MPHDPKTCHECIAVRTKNRQRALTLRSGMAARWDTFAGLIPVKVHRISVSERGKQATFKVTRNRGPYKAGEMHTRSPLWVVPLAAIKRRRYSQVIIPYRVEIDQ